MRTHVAAHERTEDVLDVAAAAPARPAGPEHDRVAVVGGGLAGLAAAAALADAGVRVVLLESRRHVGGRAASFEDPVADGLVDACQHVAMGCCTNFLDFCRRAGIAGSLRRDRTLWFIDTAGRRSACTPSRLLPAPLHLAPLLFGMRYLSLRERIALAVGMLRLTRLRPATPAVDQTALRWLEQIGQPANVIRLFWQPVLESALGESIDLVSVVAARKVAVDGFLAHRDAAELHVPTEPLGRLFGERVAGWLAARGVDLRTGVAATGVERAGSGELVGIRHAAGLVPCSAAITAVPWRQTARLMPELVPAAADSLAGSPITAVHLWFDRQVVDLPHAVLVGRVSQWVFRADDAAAPGYCQVVISASRGLFAGDRERLLATVVAELKEVFPAGREAELVASRVVTDPTAVLSVRPGVDAVRPRPTTVVPGLFRAGDWTATGWPSTMEGAVRSGRLAAEAVGRYLGRPVAGLAADLPKNLLVRLLGGGR
jgi:squalene-associated FAD-dependent desaturase